MCEFCKQHGEGKKWYLNAKNYSKELYEELKVKDRIHEIVSSFEEMMTSGIGVSEMLRNADPVSFETMKPDLEQQMKGESWGQIIPLEDAKQIFDMSISIVRLPCMCRNMLQGQADARFEFGVFMFQPDIIPHSLYPDFDGKFDVVTKEEAKKLATEFEHDGMMHSVWTFKPPFITSVCHCTSHDCMGLRSRLRWDLNAEAKAEYVATIDYEKCIGCRECMRLCNFGAVTYSSSLKKCFINQFQCWGCGICRSECAAGAISLLERNTIPELVKEW